MSPILIDGVVWNLDLLVSIKPGSAGDPQAPGWTFWFADKDHAWTDDPKVLQGIQGYLAGKWSGPVAVDLAPGIGGDVGAAPGKTSRRKKGS